MKKPSVLEESALIVQEIMSDTTRDDAGKVEGLMHLVDVLKAMSEPDENGQLPGTFDERRDAEISLQRHVLPKLQEVLDSLEEGLKSRSETILARAEAAMAQEPANTADAAQPYLAVTLASPALSHALRVSNSSEYLMLQVPHQLQPSLSYLCRGVTAIHRDIDQLPPSASRLQRACADIVTELETPGAYSKAEKREAYARMTDRLREVMPALRNLGPQSASQHAHAGIAREDVEQMLRELRHSGNMPTRTQRIVLTKSFGAERREIAVTAHVHKPELRPIQGDDWGDEA